MNPYKVHVYRQPPHITASLLKRCSRRVCRCSSSSRAPQVTIGFNTQLKSGWWCNNHLGKHEFVNGKDDNPYIYIYHGKSNSCSKPPTRKYDLDHLGVNFWETTGYSDVYPQMFQAEMRWKDGTKISCLPASKSCF